MKVFKQWLNSKHPDWNVTPLDGALRESWIAALEWALSTEYVGDHGCDFLDISAIHKELEHKDYFTNPLTGEVDGEYYWEYR